MKHSFLQNSTIVSKISLGCYQEDTWFCLDNDRSASLGNDRNSNTMACGCMITMKFDKHEQTACQLYEHRNLLSHQATD